MKAAVLAGFGETQRFSIAEIAEPDVPSGYVLIRVRTASVNPADAKIRAKGGALAPPLPAILGMDMAGEIVGVGENVTDFSINDRVYGCIGGLGNLQGTLAEFVAADARLLARMPQSLSFREAAALPLVSITAWEGLIDKAGLESGQHVLVFGATGGVGHVAVQLARSKGATVTAVVSNEQKAALTRSLGADHVVIRTASSFESELEAITNGRGFEIVFDTVGGDNLNEAMRHAGLYGQVITLVSRQSYDLGIAMSKALSLHVVFMLVPLIHDVRRDTHGSILRELATLVDTGRIRPLLDPNRYSLDTVTEAFDHVAAGRAIGKVVIDVKA